MARLIAITESSLVKTLLALALLCAAIPIASSAQAFTTVTNFGGGNGNGPTAVLTQGVDGNFYGTTINGGTGRGSEVCLPPYGGCGTVFKVTPSGTISSLYSFCSQPNCSDGSFPRGALVRGADGNYYGTTGDGGSGCQVQGGCGTVFKVTPAGTFTRVYSFCSQLNCPDGFWPAAGLVLASDGNFYGTTQGGGSHFYGTVFRMTPSGVLTTLYNFCSLANCVDGSQPEAALIQASDGNLYGTTIEGGTWGGGTIFRITLAGTLTVVHSFTGSDGSDPIAGLLQATDGNFYGTTQTGGLPNNNNCSPFGCGTVFKITPGGTLTTLYEFAGPDGGLPNAPLMQATDGNLYGTTWYGGADGNFGTVFKITTAGTLTTLHNFNGFDGEAPGAAFLQATDGSLYGTSGAGGTSNAGTVFKLTLPLQFVPVTPCRLVDTRQTGGPIQGGTARNFAIPLLGNCHIPASAEAYSLNVTVVPQGPLGYLTIWPAGHDQPMVSTMNSPDGRVKANAAIVAAGESATVSVFVTDTTNVILDIDGYFAAQGAQTYQFYPVTECRLVDTRGGHNSGTLPAGTERDYTIAGHCGIPTTATAYSFNVTVLPTNGELDYLTVWPKGPPRPNVSTLNDPTGTVVANAAIVAAGAHQTTAFYAHDNPTDLILDVNGYFAPAATGGLSLYPVTPCRVLDTRNVGSGAPFMGDWNPPDGVDVLTSPCVPPTTAKAFVFNATVIPSAPLPYLTLWPHEQRQPNVSTLNATDGAITSNMAIVQTTDGSINAYAATLTQLILDISGYFGP